MNPLARRVRYRGTRLFTFGKSVLVACALALAPAHWGCGSGGSSGQVLHAAGFFRATKTAFVPDAGRTVSLSTTISVPAPVSFGGPVDGPLVGLQNMQTTNTIITEGARLSYSIPGSGFAIPDASFAFSVSLPPQSSTLDNTVYAEALLVSPAMMDFLRASVASLPPPFTMTIAVSVQGRNDTGTSFVSNTINYNLTLTD